MADGAQGGSSVERDARSASSASSSFGPAADLQRDAIDEAPTLPVQAAHPTVANASADTSGAAAIADAAFSDTQPTLVLPARPTKPQSRSPRIHLPVLRRRARGQGPKRRVPRIALLLAAWILLFASVATAVASGLQIYQSLSRARADAANARQHLNALRALVPASATSGKLADLAPLLTPTMLATATRELKAADADFVALRADLAPVGPLGVAAHAPGAGDALTAAGLLADAGDHGSRAGLLLLSDAQTLLAYLNGGIFTDGATAKQTPALSPATIAHLRADLNTAAGEVDRAVADIHTANLSAIPSSLLKPNDTALLRTLAARWPTERTRLGTAQAWLAALPSLLGIGAPTNYLVEVMDSSELRPGGGFIGNYAIITLSGGRVEPFTLQDIYLLDRPYVSHTVYQSEPMPAQYPWWPWQDTFGLRDSNLSPDFPTNAQLAMSLLRQEGGPGVQGVIAVTPAVIERILQIVGPIPMPLYGVTVTSANLQPLIEHYQLAVSPQTNLPADDQISSANKRFVALLGRALLDRLHGLSLAHMLGIGQTFQTDVQQKDVQLYLANQASQALLAQTGYTAAVPHTPGDAVTINDTNDGYNKAGPYTTATYQDSVRLDAHGTATHDLTITYRFHAADLALLYGPDRYQTYLRIYTPPGARLTALSGLQNILGADQINHSDLPWRQMWGGYVIVEDGVPYTLHVVWTVPQAASRDSQGHWHYTLDYQRQVGAQQILHVSIGVPGDKAPKASFNGALVSDERLSVTY